MFTFLVPLQCSIFHVSYSCLIFSILSFMLYSPFFLFRTRSLVTRIVNSVRIRYFHTPYSIPMFLIPWWRLLESVLTTRFGAIRRGAVPFCAVRCGVFLYFLSQVMLHSELLRSGEYAVWVGLMGLVMPQTVLCQAELTDLWSLVCKKNIVITVGAQRCSTVLREGNEGGREGGRLPPTEAICRHEPVRYF